MISVQGICVTAIEEPRGKDDFIVSGDRPTIHLWMNNSEIPVPICSKMLHILIENESSEVKRTVRDIERKYL